MPKCNTEDIKRELAALKKGGFDCAVYYLEVELARRKKSKLNKGKTATFDDPKHKQWREASAKYRKKKLGPVIEEIKRIDAEGAGEQTPKDEIDDKFDFGA